MASSSSSAQSTPASSSRSCNYDVFLSFRGEDTRKTFVDHLFSAFTEKAIHTYKDDEKLPRGESIRPSLFKAIKESHIAVIIFSKNYADSSWCLKELTYIMKCKDKRGLIVMPVFYDVEPTEVRKQKRKFEEAFARHEKENTTKVESWRKALVAASEIGGWETKKIADGLPVQVFLWHESVVIKKIVNTILDRLSSVNPYIDEEFVGMTTRIQDLKSQLEIGSDGVLMVGVWGIGGGGKTTLATSVYMEISHHFEGKCIVEGIREKSSKSDYGLQKLQENILSAVFKTEEKVRSVIEGKRLIRSMLCRRKVLLVLDDVDQLEQLEALAGSHNCFGCGSRVIITTRDEHLLKAHKVDKVCPVRLLSAQEAIELFNKHAYNEKEPIEDYERLSLYVVSYAAGLPLALKVLGSFLYSKNEEEWLSALDRLKDIPEKDIVEKLKISYDGLKTEEKELFLDIACYFRGMKWSNSNDPFYIAREVLEACGFHLEIGIKVLRQKALINIDAEGRLEMHDLVQEMAHYIVRRDHPNNPEYHSRIWKEEEITNLRLWEATEKNDKIETITRSYVARKDVMSRLCKNVSNMKKLRWLDVRFFGDGDGDGGPTFLSNELRYIYWRGYLGILFPDNFQPTKLVVLKLECSSQKVLWKSYKDLPCLKVLELTNMKNLVSTPDFKRLPCLQKLTLQSCGELEVIDASLGNHTSLEYVCVSFCQKLSKFPTIVQMGKLQTLSIRYCMKIVEFPGIQANMESLVNLSLIATGIEVLPSSIGEHCTNLTSLDLIYCDNLKSIEFNMDVLRCLKEFKYPHWKPWLQLSAIMRFHQFPRSLKKLVLSNCGIKDGKILFGILELSNLEELDLSNNDFSRLESGLSQLTRLKILNLKGCRSLVGLPELPSSVAILNAPWCESLTESLANCKCLCGVSISPGSIIHHGNKVLEYMFEGKTMENGTVVFTLEGGPELAKGLARGLLRKGNKCRLQLQENWRNEFCGFLMCGVSKSSFYAHITMEGVKSVSMDCEDEVDWKESGDDKYTWVGCISFASLRDTRWWNQTYNQLLFDLDQTYNQLLFNKSCNGFGVTLVGKRSESGSDPTDFSQFSDYTCCLDHVPPYGLRFRFH